MTTQSSNLLATAASLSLACVFFAALSSIGFSQERYLDWTDNSGNFKVKAKFERIEGDDVVLLRSDGKEIKVPQARLSDESRKQVEQEKRQREDLGLASEKMPKPGVSESKKASGKSELGQEDEPASQDNSDRLEKKALPVAELPKGMPPKRISNWPKPEVIIDQLGKMALELSDLPLPHTFKVVQRIEDQLYEILVEDPREMAGRAILRTKRTLFKTTGLGTLPLIFTGEKDLELKNGFSEKFNLFEESEDYSLKEIDLKIRETESKASALMLPLVYSCLAWQVDWEGSYDSTDHNLGYSDWLKKIVEKEGYHPIRYRRTFSALPLAKAYYVETCKKKFTAAHLAADMLDIEMLEKLALAGADLNDKGFCENSPVMTGVKSYLKTTKYGNGYVEVSDYNRKKREINFSIDYLESMLDLFEKNGVDLSREASSSGGTLMHLAVSLALNSTNADNVKATLRLLAEKKIDGRVKNKFGFTNLHLFVLSELMRSNDEEPERYQEGFGAKPKSIDSEREERNKQIFQYLLECGADINAQDQFGNTVLHIAVGYGRLDLAKLIVDNEARKSIRNKQNLPASDLFTRAYPKIINGRLADWNEMLKLLK